MEIFKLNADQQKAFNELKRAYKKCEKLNILFYNDYGALGAVDKAKIISYDDNAKNGIYDSGQNLNSFKIAGEWADDPHYFHVPNSHPKLY